MTNLELINEIKEQRERIISNKKKILSLTVQISDLSINNNVAKYIYYSDYENYDECSLLEDDPKVQEYLVLKEELDSLKHETIDYYKNIQINLKDSLEDEDIDIYVYNGKVNRNIINKEQLSNNAGTIIYPVKELNSKRKLRHFYNKKSFKYLEELTKDNNYSLDNKNLGRVKILSK